MVNISLFNYMVLYIPGGGSQYVSTGGGHT